MNSLGSVIYAARLADGTIKIGCTTHFGQRLTWLKSHVGLDVELLAFRFGAYEDEQAIHASLREHLRRGREYYHPDPEVLAVVNAMRDDLHMPHIAA
jgi:hypothetical protein